MKEGLDQYSNLDGYPTIDSQQLVAFDKLSDELHFLIISYGCEDDLYTDSVPCFRKMKEFAQLARLVCARWKVLIDNSTVHSYWIARLQLRVTFPDGKEYRARGEPLLVQRLATFRRQLLTSKGCDLTIKLTGPGFRFELEGGGTPIPDAAAKMRLMLHLMDMMTPYQSQIVWISLQTGRTEISIHFLRLIETWTAARRLLEISFGSPLTDPPTALSKLISQPSHLGYSSLLRKKLATPVRLDHPPKLDALALPFASWSNEELTLPITLRHLQVLTSSHNAIPAIYDSLLTDPLLQNQIRSIHINLIATKDENGRSPSRAVPTMTLPRLRGIKLYGVTGYEVAAFISLFTCPYVDVLAVHLHKTLSRMGSTSSISMVPLEQPRGLDAMGRNVIPYPRLSHLNLRVTYSEEALDLLRLLASWSIEGLCIELRVRRLRIMSSPPTEELRDRFISVISQFIPSNLLVEYDWYHDVRSMLSSMCTHFLDTLNIRVVHLGWPALDKDEDEPQFACCEVLALPQLTKLTLQGVGSQLAQFLARLQADRLHSLAVECKVEPEPEFSSRISRVLNDARQSSAGLTTAFVWNGVKPIMESLTYTDADSVSFPQLRWLRVGINWRSHTEPSFALRTELLRLTTNMLTFRAESGASPLSLVESEVSLFNNPINKGFWARFTPESSN